MQRYRDGEQWWLTDEESGLAVREQDQRMQGDAWEDTIANAVFGHLTYTSAQILSDIIKMPIERHDQRAKDRVAAIMADLGWTQAYGKERQTDGTRKSIRLWRLDR